MNSLDRAIWEGYGRVNFALVTPIQIVLLNREKETVKIYKNIYHYTFIFFIYRISLSP